MDLLKNNVVAGVGLAFAAAVLAPVLMPAMGRIGRPLAKSLVRGGMMMYEKGREAIAVAGESVEDIMAEVRAEGATGSARAQAPAPAPAPQATSPATAQETHTERPYTGNGAAHGAHGATAAATAPDGAPGTDAGNI